MASAAEHVDQSDVTRVFRRIHPNHFPEAGDIARRPSSAAFTDSSDGSSMSVDIDRGQNPADSLRGLEGFGLVALHVGALKAQGFVVVPVPVPGNPHHAEVRGEKTKAKKRQMAKDAEWLVPEGGPP